MANPSVDLSLLVDRAKGNIDKAVRQALILAAQGVVMNSPVDTGRLRGSWNFGVSAPNNQTTGILDNTPDEGAPIRGVKTVNRLSAEIAAITGGPTFYITTNLAYARRIEYEGWSHTKAPNGMVRITLANLPNAIKRYVAGLK